MDPNEKTRRGSSNPLDVVTNISKEDIESDGLDLFQKEGFTDEPPEKFKSEETGSDNNDSEEEIEDNTNASNQQASDDDELDLFNKTPVQQQEEGKEQEEELDNNFVGQRQDEDGDTDDEINVGFYLAGQLKKDGWLPDTFEVKKDTTLSDAYNTFIGSIEEDGDNLKKAYKQEALNELAEDGYTKEDLQYAKIKRSGVNTELLDQSNRYRLLGQVDLTKASDTDKEGLIKYYYQDRQWDKTEIEDKMRDISEEDLESLSKTSINYFRTKDQNLMVNLERQAESNKAAQAKIIESQVKKVNTLLTKGELLGDKINSTKKFREAIYSKNQTVKRGEQDIPASELQIFLENFKDNAEVKLWAFNKWLNRNQDVDQVKKDAETKAQEDLLQGLKKVITKSKSRTTTRKVNQSLSRIENERGNTSNSSSKSIFIQKYGNRPRVVNVGGKK